jgi:hypothetical protein
VTRQLRASFKPNPDGSRPFGLPKAGNGSNAHRIDAFEASLILICYAGCEVAARCIERLIPLTCLQARHVVDVGTAPLPTNFGQVVCDALELLEVRAAISEIRIGRNIDFARVVTTDGRTINYCGKRKRLPQAELEFARSFASEGVLPQNLLAAVAEGLASLCHAAHPSSRRTLPARYKVC